ncbi:MAG: PAS domain S-box protein [Elusimicrobia bacterium]|nr:PAS domain S-box protein [Elusimicrobiota bacterium]
MLRLQSNSFKLLCEFTPLPIWIVDQSSQYFLEVNEAARRKYGFRRDEFLSMKISDIHFPEELPRLQAALTSPHGPKHRTLRFKHRAKKGVLLDVELTCRPMEFDGRQAYLCVVQDVTQQRMTAEALAGTKERLAKIVANAPVVVFSIDKDGIFTISEGRGVEALRRKHGETVGKSVFEVYRHNQVIVANLRRALRGEDFTDTVEEAGRVFETHYMPQRREGEVVGIIGVAVDITERFMAEALLRRQQAAMEISTDGIHIEGKDQNLCFVNSALVRMYGYDRAEDMLGKNWRFLFDEEEVRRIETEVNPVLNRTGIWRGEAFGRRRDGTRFLQELSVTLMQDGGAIAVSRDITERKRSEEERARLLACERAARADAEQASRAKDEFLAILSHEMRTPMTAMLGWTWLLKTGTLDAEGQAKALDIIHKNMTQQAQTIEDLLDVSRIVTGKLKLETRLIDPRSVLEAVAENIQPAAAAKSIRLELDCEPSSGPALGDPDRLQQAVWNLASNALKFTPEGGVIRIELRKAGSKIEIRVTDTGQGFSPEYVPFLFDRFKQAEDPLTRTFRGLGLGLAIVKLLVEAHGGSVEASSSGIGKGSTFIIRLPVPAVTLDVPASTVSGGRVHASVLPRLDGVRVLVVDDEEDTLDMIGTVLRQCGAEVQLAASAGQALQFLATFRPDVFLSDITMPGEDGISLIRKVRSLDSENGGRVPAAALTASAKVEDRTRVLLAGYQIYVSKPVEPVELAAVVGNLAGRTPK